MGKKINIVISVAVLLVIGAGYLVYAQEINTNVVDLSADLKNWALEVARGNVKGHSAVQKFGASDSVGTTFEDVWDLGGKYYWRDTATTLNLSSSSTADTWGGTGAWQLQIQGLDSNYDLQTETINLSGQTPVQTTKSYIRVFRMLVTQAGTTKSNEGMVYLGESATITNGVPDDLTKQSAHIHIDHAQTLMALYTIPNGYTGYLVKGWATSGAGKNTEVHFHARPFGGADNLKFDFDMLDYAFIYEYGIPLEVPEKTDLWVEAKVDSGTTKVSSGFDIVLIANT